MEIPVIVLEFLIKWLLFPVRRCKLFVYKYVKKERLANWGILKKEEKNRLQFSWNACDCAGCFSPSGRTYAKK